MKKLFIFMAMILTTVGSFAQSWPKPVNPDAQEFSSTWIIANLNTNLAGNIKIAAFIEDENRVEVVPQQDEAAGSQAATIYSIRVPSYPKNGKENPDEGKNITFRAFDPSTGLEYVLAEKFKFENDATYGTPTAPVTLNLIAPTSYTIKLAEVEVGVEYDLFNLLVVQPDNAIKPYNLKWEAGIASASGVGSQLQPAEGVTISDGKLKASKPVETLKIRALIEQTNFAVATVEVDVVSHAKSITLTETSLPVEKTEYGTRLLNEFATGDVLPYTIDPQESTDAKKVKWQVEAQDKPVLSCQDNVFTILSKGTARIRPYIVVNKKNEGAQETIIYPKDKNGNETWVTVTVTVPVEDIDVNPDLFGERDEQNNPIYHIKANKNDKNISARLKKIVKVLPADASNSEFYFQKLTGPIDIDNDNITPTGAGEATILVITRGKTAITDQAAPTDGGDGQPNAATEPQAMTATIKLVIEDPVTAPKIADGQTVQYVELKDVNTPISLSVEDLKKFITLPGNAKENVSIDVTIVSTSSTSDPQKPAVTGEAKLGGPNDEVSSIKAVAEGEAELKIVATWRDYASWSGKPADVPTTQNQPVTFRVVVQKEVQLHHFDVAYTTAVAGQEVTVTLTPSPNAAAFEPSDVDVKFAAEGWSDNVITSTRTSANRTAIVYTFTTLVPGNVTLTCATPLYSGQAELKAINVGYPLKLAKGWQWRSNPWGNVASEDIATIYGGEKETGKLQEIRTQNDLLFNDDELGYFGTLMETEGIKPYQCYKVKMKDEYSHVMYSTAAENINAKPQNVQVADGKVSVALAAGWNWIGCPYFFNRSITKAVTAESSLPDGLVIVGKENSTEYSTNGTPWNGNLEYLEGGNGYLVYNPGQALTITFPAEKAWEPRNEDQGELGVKAYTIESNNIWSYDHTRFMNNMTMVTVLDGVDNSENYSVGAFVGNECRGEGFYQNGKFYITVHCDGGELVTFKTFNRLTGEIYNIDACVRAKTRIGSLRAPFHLQGNATGINDVKSADAATESFDLSGRRISGRQRGITLQRTANGTYRKVMK